MLFKELILSTLLRGKKGQDSWLTFQNPVLGHTSHEGRIEEVSSVTRVISSSLEWGCSQSARVWGWLLVPGSACWPTVLREPAGSLQPPPEYKHWCQFFIFVSGHLKNQSNRVGRRISKRTKQVTSVLCLAVYKFWKGRGLFPMGQQGPGNTRPAKGHTTASPSSLQGDRKASKRNEQGSCS